MSIKIEILIGLLFISIKSHNVLAVVNIVIYRCGRSLLLGYEVASLSIFLIRDSLHRILFYDNEVFFRC